MPNTYYRVKQLKTNVVTSSYHGPAFRTKKQAKSFLKKIQKQYPYGIFIIETKEGGYVKTKIH